MDMFTSIRCIHACTRLEDPTIAEAAKAVQMEGGGELVPHPCQEGEVDEDAAAAVAAEAAAMAVVAQPPHQYQQHFMGGCGFPGAELAGGAAFHGGGSGSGLASMRDHSDPPASAAAEAAAAAAAMTAGYPEPRSSGAMDFMSMMDACALPGFGGPAGMGFGGAMIGMGLPGVVELTQGGGALMKRLLVCV